MGVVYRARDDRWVALEILSDNVVRNRAFRQRFIRESRAAAAVDHPNILPVFDAGEADGVFYIAVRLVLLETTHRIASEVHDDPRAIAILGLTGAGIYGPAAERLTRQDLALLQAEVNACFWERRWLKGIAVGADQPHAFAERPLCRITSARRLFVTSEHNIADSTTMFNEHAMGLYSARMRQHGASSG